MTTTRVTGTDGKQYDVSFDPGIAALGLDASAQVATLKPATVTIKSVAPVAVVTTPPPVTTPAPTAGVISGFTANAGSRFNVDGISYGVQNAGKPYSLTEVDSQTLRFEVHQGENWTGADSAGSDRSELNSTKTYPAGTPVTLNYQFMVEANGAGGAFNNTAWYFVVGQWHNDDNALGVGTSPPVAFNMAGNKLQVLARYVLPGGKAGNGPGNTTVLKTLWTDPNPIVTGVYHAIKMQANFKNDSTGYLKVWVDGVQVVSYSGPLGYGTGTNWEYGVYRSTSPETVAVNYRAVTISSS